MSGYGTALYKYEQDAVQKPLIQGKGRHICFHFGFCDFDTSFLLTEPDNLYIPIFRQIKEILKKIAVIYGGFLNS